MRLVVLFLFSFGFCFSQNTFVPDDNFEQALIDLGYDSGPLDDFVTTAAINTITFLDLGDLNISDLTGIQDFASLDHLKCELNDLSVLDVSNNTNLRILKCDQNNLTSLTLGANSTLEQIWTYNNFLTSIDLSQLPNLEVLSVLENNLNTIDVSSNLMLRNFWCYNNNISNIDVSNNSQLEILWCSQNNLSSLDLTNNLNLETLLCFQNDITALDLSNNSELVYLACYANNLTSLNVKNGNNINVTNFQAYGNPQLDCIEVDDPVYSEANWTEVSSNVSFFDDCDNLSVDDAVFQNIEVYPNPARNQLNIKGLNVSKFECVFYDVNGREIMRSSSDVLDVSNFNSGVYYLKIFTNNTILIQKVVKN